MTTNDQIQIGFHKRLLGDEPYGIRTMPVVVPAETVCIEFPDGSTLYGTVTAESAEVDGHLRVVTKTVRVHCSELETHS